MFILPLDMSSDNIFYFYSQPSTLCFDSDGIGIKTFYFGYQLTAESSEYI